MHKLIKSIIVFCILFNSNTIVGQIIPSEWEGVWQGTVDIWSYNVKKDSFPMSLEITPRDSLWNFVISYNRDVDKADTRKYELLVAEESKFHLVIDEKNSIMLDSYFNDNCLYSKFHVMTSDIETQICMNNGDLEYKITSYRSEAVRFSGKGIIKSDTIPEVRSYSLYQVMNAQLKKIE